MTYAVRPDINGLSPLATRRVPVLRDTKDRTEPVFGVAVHCTGSGVVSKALARGRDPLAEATALYGSPKRMPYFGHYVVGFGGEVVQVADEHEAAPHVGLTKEERALFLGGGWPSRLPADLVARWRARWLGKASPSHLYPGPSANNVYVGVELLVWLPGCPGKPPRAPGRYTDEQVAALAALARDVAGRWGFPAGWARTARLAAHEDLNPLSRTTNGKGWDPGIMRDGPWFDWGRLVAACESR